jgi:hypothetical protein
VNVRICRGQRCSADRWILASPRKGSLLGD